MRHAILAGLVYWAIVFALGFVMGTLRVLVLAPLLGPVAAVSLELPIMLAGSWLACGWSLRRFGVGKAFAERAAMGLLAFTLLILAEFALSTLLFGRTAAEHWASYATTEARLGLAAQVLFATFPLLRR